jgi:hypothetical protein
MTKRNSKFGGFASLLHRSTKAYPDTEMYLHSASYGVDDGVTANVGSTQATGHKVTKTYTVISTCANAGDSLTLPRVTVIGTVFHIKNNGAQAADIFPPVSGNIDGAGANTAVAVAATGSGAFVLTSYNASTGVSTWSRF